MLPLGQGVYVGVRYDGKLSVSQTPSTGLRSERRMARCSCYQSTESSVSQPTRRPHACTCLDVESSRR